jgi:hypothetical protein
MGVRMDEASKVPVNRSTYLIMAYRPAIRPGIWRTSVKEDVELFRDQKRKETHESSSLR